MFSPPEKKIDHELKEKVNSKKHYQTDSVKYLGINLDKYLPWKHKINNVATKPNKVNAMLIKDYI